MKRKDPLQTAYEKGAQAARDGLAESACPYLDERTHTGAVTWSRAFMKRWLDGYREVKG